MIDPRTLFVTEVHKLHYSGRESGLMRAELNQFEYFNSNITSRFLCCRGELSVCGRFSAAGIRNYLWPGTEREEVEEEEYLY